VALVLTLVLSTLPILVSAQDASGPVELRRSEEFGYLFWWDPAEWAVEVEDTEAGSDWIRLGNDTAFVDIWGLAAPGMTAGDCVGEHLRAIESDSAVVRFESLWQPGAAPEVTVSPDGLSAAAAFVLAIDTDDGRVTIAANESCVALEPGETLLSTSEWVQAEAFNAHGGRFGAAPLGTVTLPPSALRFAPGDAMAVGPTGFGVNVRILDDAGEELGILTSHSPNCFYLNRLPTVVIENTGVAALEIAPDAFVAIADGIEHPPTTARWLWPSIAGDQSVVLEPGDIAILQLEYFGEPTWAPIIFNNAWGPALDVGSTGVTGCGGGAAPIVIDME
jgi:hypothetical protein